MATQTIPRGANGKSEFVVLPSAARALAQDYTSDDFVVPYGKTLTLVIDITAGAATPSVTPKFRGVTPTGIVYTVLTGAAITSTSAAQVIMRVGHGIAEVANLGTAIPLPAQFRLVMTHADTDSLTYSVSAEVS